MFFSIYKGSNPSFILSKWEVDDFFSYIKPQLQNEMDKESLSLFNETIDEKLRLLQGVRFPENDLNKPCYLSMSERVFDYKGNEYCCSHLFRDKILTQFNSCDPLSFKKHKKCLYGCNRRLIKFNEDVELGLK